MFQCAAVALVAASASGEGDPTSYLFTSLQLSSAQFSSAAVRVRANIGVSTIVKPF